MIRLVFDVDDTICVHNNRDYPNAIPKSDVIAKINYLHDILGYEIVLYTSRGMVSCNGDLEKIVEKNLDVLTKWLKEHDVHYDKLEFGKPFADMYIDDKCLNVEEFLNQEFYELKGGSGRKVSRVGNIVKKEASLEKINKTKIWSNKAKKFCSTPKIISSAYESLFMEYVQGITLSQINDYSELLNNVYKIITKISMFAVQELDSFNIQKHIDVLNKNKVGDNEYINNKIDKCIELLKKYEKTIAGNATFCHGDLTLSNVILEDKTNELYFIDPEMDEEASSFLLDLAKLRMSLMGYEQKFNLTNSTIPLSPIRGFLDSILIGTGIYNEVIILNFMYILRLWRYKEEDQRNLVIEMLKELEEENEELFR